MAFFRGFSLKIMISFEPKFKKRKYLKYVKNNKKNFDFLLPCFVNFSILIFEQRTIWGNLTL